MTQKKAKKKPTVKVILVRLHDKELIISIMGSKKAVDESEKIWREVEGFCENV